jgi:hypothetical protein
MIHSIAVATAGRQFICARLLFVQMIRRIDATGNASGFVGI